MEFPDDVHVKQLKTKIEGGHQKLNFVVPEPKARRPSVPTEYTEEDIKAALDHITGDVTVVIQMFNKIDAKPKCAWVGRIKLVQQGKISIKWATCPVEDHVHASQCFKCCHLVM